MGDQYGMINYHKNHNSSRLDDLSTSKFKNPLSSQFIFHHFSFSPKRFFFQWHSEKHGSAAAPQPHI